MTHRADRAPEEVAKVDDQVGRYAITCFVDFLRLKDFGADMRTIVVNQRLEFSLQFVAQLLNLTGLNNTLRLTSLDIEEDTSIVTAVPPDFGLAPIDFASVDGGQGLWLCFQRQVSLTDEPFIDANATIHLFCAMV